MQWGFLVMPQSEYCVRLFARSSGVAVPASEACRSNPGDTPKLFRVVTDPFALPGGSYLVEARAASGGGGVSLAGDLVGRW